MESLTDPESLVDRDNVDFREEASVEHQHHFELYEPIEGMVIVGVTDDDGRVLLMVHREEPGAVLPYAPVESGEDWVGVARRKIEEAAGFDVEIDGVELVRRKYFSPEGDDECQTMGYDVIVRATPSTDETFEESTSVGEEGDWSLKWFDEISEDAAGGAVLDDIRLFLDD